MESLDLNDFPFSTKELFLICQSGGRSMKVVKNLMTPGLVTSMEGGTSAWQSAGLPVVEKKCLKAGSNCHWFPGGDRGSHRQFTPGGIRVIDFHRSGFGICRGDGYLWNGDDDRKMPWNRSESLQTQRALGNRDGFFLLGLVLLSSCMKRQPWEEVDSGEEFARTVGEVLSPFEVFGKNPIGLP